MFGGWTAAVALSAVLADSDGSAVPASMTVNFVDQIRPGDDLVVRTRRVGGGRSVGHWHCEVTSRAGDTLVVASVVLASRRDTDGRVEVTMPEAGAPESIAVVPAAPGPMGERTTVRPVIGFPPFSHESSYSLAWVREITSGALDHRQLSYLADHRPPRSFYWSDGPRLSATLSLTISFHATAEELLAVGDDELLSEAFGVRGSQSLSEEHLRLWSRQGTLVATSVQMGWYR